MPLSSSLTIGAILLVVLMDEARKSAWPGDIADLIASPEGSA